MSFRFRPKRVIATPRVAVPIPPDDLEYLDKMAADAKMSRQALIVSLLHAIVVDDKAAGSV